MLATRYTPSDADRLLRDRGLTAYACDVVMNPAFRNSDARTRDAHGRRVADYVRTRAEREAWPERVAQLVRLRPSELEQALKSEPVKLSLIKEADGGERTVGIPTFLRRCVANLVAEVLVKTSDHLLSDAAIAYRRGHRDAVPGAIREVARAVRAGRVRYFARLDLKSYFPSIEWSAVERTLTDLGYSERFVGVVMALVRCPLHKRNEKGRLVPTPNAKGVQMGVAGSDILANLFPLVLDQTLGRLLPKRGLYLRYSDDPLLGAPRRSDVVGAVRVLQNWCREHGLKLKDVSTINEKVVSPDTHPEKLVRDIRETRIRFLGAEIDHTARIHIPEEKLQAKLGEIERRVDGVPDRQVIEGVSRYGNGAGLDVFDEADVFETVDGFKNHWRGLDPEGVRRADVDINKKLYPLGSRDEGAKVWIAQLWRVQAAGGAEAMIPAGHDPTDPPGAAPLAPTGRGEAREAPRSDTGRFASGGRSVPEPSLAEAFSESPQRVPYTEAAIGSLTRVDGEVSSEALSDAGEEDSLNLASDGADNTRFDASSEDPSEGENFLIDQIEKDLSEKISGSEANSREEPPLPAALREALLVHLYAERLPDGRHVLGVLPAREGQPVGKASTLIVRGRPEVALVRRMNDLVGRHGRRVTFALVENRLPKTLLQEHRRLQAAGYFLAVVELHETARQLGVDVRIAGGIRAPARLLAAVREKREADSSSVLEGSAA